ncbi:MAG: 30S ribosomal protein S20 [Myxococcales bacterium]|nr:30S ribosomal protein S20 [Myxococcales bacterium]
MANTKSAIKRHRQSLKRRERNVFWNSVSKGAVKKARAAIITKDPAKIVETLRAAEKMLRKAVSKGILHPRNASRRISRLATAAAAAMKPAAT